MKIAVTKDGKVSFTGMEPGLAEALLDLARNLNSRECVLLYGPGYVPVVRPTDALRDEFDRMLHADAQYPGAISADYDDSRWFSSEPLLEETHILVWDEIFPPARDVEGAVE